jgi:putative FmdB family regulatory protein
MPIYEYICTKCGLEFEKLQKISDSTIPSCVSCSSREVKRKISLSSFVLKGTGWYATDYQKKSNENIKKSTGIPEEKKPETPAPSKETSPAPVKTA